MHEFYLVLPILDENLLSSPFAAIRDYSILDTFGYFC